MLEVKLELLVERQELGSESYFLQIEVESKDNPLPIDRKELKQAAAAAALAGLSSSEPADVVDLWFDGKDLMVSDDNVVPAYISKVKVLRWVMETARVDNWYVHLATGRYFAKDNFDLGNNIWHGRAPA
jgi:hypothetical protein